MYLVQCGERNLTADALDFSFSRYSLQLSANLALYTAESRPKVSPTTVQLIVSRVLQVRTGISGLSWS